MPLTPIQTEVLRLIAGNRSPASHVAGGIALNFSPDSARTSKDSRPGARICNPQQSVSAEAAPTLQPQIPWRLLRIANPRSLTNNFERHSLEAARSFSPRPAP